MLRVSLSLLAASSLFIACSSGTGDGTGGAGNDGTGSGASTGGTSPGSGGAGSGSTTGSGSAAGTGSASGSGGTGGGTGGGGTFDCASLPVCDDFESGTVGMAPDPTVWGTQLDYGNNGGASSVVVDTTEAHSGANSVKVLGANGVYGITVDNPGTSFYLRAWMKSVGRVGWPVLLGLGTDPGAEVRVRLKSDAVAINIVPGDGLNPVETTTGNCPSCVAIPSDWFCLRVHADHTTQTFEIWVGDVQAGAVTGNAPWHGGTNIWPASFSTLRLGAMALEGDGGTVYIDDVAIGPDPIACE